MNEHSITSQPITSLPSDSLKRSLKDALPDTDQSLPHVGLVGYVYHPALGRRYNGRFA